MTPKPTFYPAKRRKLSVPPHFHDTLHDITNTDQHTPQKTANNLKPSQLRQQQQQPLKHLTKSEIAAIAAKKRDEVAQLKSRQRLLDTLKELDIKIDEIQRRDIPGIIYDIRKRRKMIKSTLMTHDSLLSDLTATKLEYEGIGVKLEAEREELRVNLEMEAKKTSSRLETELRSVAAQRQEELAELDKIQPKGEVLSQIVDLKKQLKQLEHELELLRVSNEKIISEREVQLNVSLDLVKSDKLVEQSGLVEGFNKAKLKKSKLSGEVDSTTSKIDELHEIQSELQAQISGVEGKVLENENAKRYPERRYKELVESLNSIEHKLANIKEEEPVKREKLSIQRKRLEEETMKRLRMENYIDNLRAHARVFGYIPNTTDQVLESFLEFRAQDGTLKKTDVGRLFELNRLISLDELKWWSNAWSPAMRYKVYIDSCLQKGEDFNMFTVSTERWSWNPQTTFLEYFRKNYLNRYSIKIQKIVLSPGDSAKVNLSDNGTIQMDAEEFSSEDDFLDRFATGEIPEEGSPYIKVLKFHFKENSSTNDRSVQFYFVQLENNETVSLLRNILWGKYPWDINKLGIFVHTLLRFTHSCFLFNFCSEDKHVIRSLVQTAKKLGFTPDPFSTRGLKASK